MCFSAKHFRIRKTDGPMASSGLPSSCTAASLQGPLALASAISIRKKLRSRLIAIIELCSAFCCRGAQVRHPRYSVIDVVLDC